MSPTTSEITRESRPWKTAILAGMASYLDAGTLITVGIALVLYAPTLGISANAIGLLSGMLTLCFAAGAIIGGRLGDRFGRRRVFSVTLIVFAVGTLLLALATGLPMLVIGIVLVGFAIGADLPVSLALISEEAPEGKKGQMIGFSAVLWLVGILVPIGLSIGVAPLGAPGGRIMFGQLVLVAIIVLIARRTLRESAEWKVKTGAISVTDVENEIKFSHVKQLFTMPVLLTVIATGLYYAIWNLGANSFGQFGTFFLVNLAGLTVQTASVLNLVTFPLGLVSALIFMRLVDRPVARRTMFLIGTVMYILGFLVPAVLGFSATSFVVLLVLFGFGTGFCGEAMYKVWSQELFPTLLRSSAQGLTIAFARVIAGLVAFVTPALATGNPGLLFWMLAAFAIISGIIGVFWIPRLKTAKQLEATPVIVPATR